MDKNEKLKEEFILLGKHIKKLREERSLTLDELAEKTGIKAQYLDKIEKGTAIRIAVFRHLLRLAIAFKIELTDILKFR